MNSIGKIKTHDDADLIIAELQKELQTKRQKSLLAFTKATMPTFNPADFHKQYYSILTRFANKEFNKLMVFMPPQHGKQLSDETLVPTPTGFKRHGDLVVGDVVFGRNGKHVRVEWVSPKTKTEYRVTFNTGQQIDCHGNHEWTVFDTSKRKELTIETNEIAAKPIRRGSHYRFMVDSPQCVEFEQKNVLIDAYTLGAWLGDGVTEWPKIHIGGGDIEIINAIPYETKEGSGTTDRVFYIHGISAQFKHYGLLGNKHIPDDYVFNSEECRKNLIAGLIDTDGYVYPKNGRVTISNTNRQIIEKSAMILRSLGQSVTITSFAPCKSTSGINGRKTVYQLCFNPTIEFPTKVPRKRICRKIANHKRAIIDIRRLDESERTNGNCIQVDGGVYLVGEHFIPTHNSEGSTRRLPAFLLGRNPDTRVAIVSYSAPKARKFNREIQRIIDSDEYRAIFPDTRLNAKNITTVAGSWLRNADECEIVGHRGGFKTVGVGGPLTGEPVDVLIMDDIYKDAKTAWSATVRESIEDWYDTVGETRLHNESRQLIVFTRWHEEDLAGKLLERQGVYGPDNPDGWVVVSFPAIKVGPPTEFDNREDGAALWPERHSLEKLKSIEKGNPQVFASLYQQNPKPFEGLMYNNFRTYDVLPIESGKMKNYTDTADTGEDWLCSICYYETATACYITDILYTKKPMEYTESETARMLVANNVSEAVIESNNGGRGFMRNVESNVRKIGDFRMRFIGKTQHLNKEVRIFSHSAELQNILHFPTNWERRFPEFAHDLKSYRKEGKNAHDDCADAATGIVEEFTTKPRAKGITIRN